MQYNVICVPHVLLRLNSTVLVCLSIDLSVSTVCSASVYQSVVYHSVALCTAVLVFTAVLR